MNMNINETYSAVIYRGLTSAVIVGKVAAILSNSELDRYGVNGTRLYAENYHLLPSGTPNNAEGSTWYVMRNALADGGETIINSDWIKPNGITYTESSEVTISGTFSSQDTVANISAMLKSGGVKDASVSVITGEAKWSTTNLRMRKRYSITLSDNDGSVVNGVFEGSVSQSMLETLGISAVEQYTTFEWPISRLQNLAGYSWNVFSPFESDGVKFAMPSELIETVDEYDEQGSYAIRLQGRKDDIGMIRSILSYMRCTKISLGTGV